MPSFNENSSNAANVSDKLIEIKENKPGDSGTPIRIMSDFWECVPEHWLTDSSGNKRRVRCANINGEECYTCKMLEQIKFVATENNDPSRRVYWYTPAAPGQIVRGKNKEGKIVTIIQFVENCKILKYGVTLFRKFYTLNKHPDYAEDGGILSRTLSITKMRQGASNIKIKYDAIPSPKPTSKPKIDGVEEAIAEIKALANEPIDIVLVNKFLGIVGNDTVSGGSEEVTEQEMTGDGEVILDVNDTDAAQVANTEEVATEDNQDELILEDSVEEPAADESELIIEDDKVTEKPVEVAKSAKPTKPTKPKK